MHTKLPETDAGPVVAVPFTDAATTDDVAEAAAHGMDVVEWRVDRFTRTDADHVVEVIGRCGATPRIVTIRSAAEAGGWDGDEKTRLALFEAVAPRVGALDIEGSSTAILGDVVALARDHGCTAVVSFHDFDATPTLGALTEVVAAARVAGADVVKLATMVHHSDDLRVLATLLCVDDGIDKIVIGMGPLGASSRLLFPFLGSRLTFAAHPDPSAPGQLPLEDMAETLRRLSPAYATRHPGR